MIFLGGGGGGGGGRSVGQIMYRKYVVFRGSNISCSLACYDLACEANMAATLRVSPTKFLS